MPVSPGFGVGSDFGNQTPTDRMTPGVAVMRSVGRLVPVRSVSAVVPGVGRVGRPVVVGVPRPVDGPGMARKRPVYGRVGLAGVGIPRPLERPLDGRVAIVCTMVCSTCPYIWLVVRKHRYPGTSDGEVPG